MKKGKILVVDDNQGIRKALKLLLTPYFAEVEIIASPNTLVNTMESFRPDVVLLDMNFNTDINTDNEGLYWTSQLKKMYPDVQVVLFTAYADIVVAMHSTVVLAHFSPAIVFLSLTYCSTSYSASSHTYHGADIVTVRSAYDSSYC